MRKIASGKYSIFPEKYETKLVRTTSLKNFYSSESDLQTEPIQYLENGDVAVIYDTGRGLFDHHQDSARRYNNFFDLKFCGFGLLFDKWGADYIHNYITANDKHCRLAVVYDTFVKDFVMGIDAHDNGQRFVGLMNNISGLITRMNPAWDDPTPREELFEKACNLMEMVFDNEIDMAISKATAIPIIDMAITEALDKKLQYCVFDRFVPAMDTILSSERTNDILYIIYPSNHREGEWIVHAVPKEPGSYETRKSLPKHLWGMGREYLMKQKWTFVHATGFLGAADSKEDAIRLAEYSISYEKNYEH
jgi:uncharacterized UPF0160 family protein